MDTNNKNNKNNNKKKKEDQHTKKKSGAATSSSSSSSSSNSSSSSFLTKYFLVILFIFACVSLFLNTRFTHIIVEDVSTIEQFLEQSVISRANTAVANVLATTTTGGGGGAELGGGDRNGQDDDDESRIDKAAAADMDATAEGGKNHHDLNCDAYGGPDRLSAQEMVYWKDIPSDAKHVSPFHHSNKDGGVKQRQFMTFEPDHGGWNNIRMAMETVLTMAFAMGRTLVLPPHQKMYLLGKDDEGQRNEFSFEHFFHMERIHEEHYGLDILSMEEFLRDYVMKGIFLDPSTNQPMFPPQNRTNWNGGTKWEIGQLSKFLRNNITSAVVLWVPEDCVAAFPKSTSEEDVQIMNDLQQKSRQSAAAVDAQKKNNRNPGSVEFNVADIFPDHMTYVDHPTPVDAPPLQRLQENFANRKELCIYDKTLQDAQWVHFPVQRSGDTESRLLVHFYAFLFFQDWKEDLWMKRFVRDHVRYVDEIQCAAARVVHGVRQHVLRKTNGTSDQFDTIHIRRGDFQYKVTRVEATEIYEMTKRNIPDGSTLYIATDERDKTFFNALKQHYDVVFLDDFLDTISGVNTNYYGMIDQLISTRGRVFFGCWFSTFTGYINRVRGYHHHKTITHDESMGIVPSYYYALPDRYEHMQHYWPIKKSFWAREFPTSWRLIDTGVEDEAVTKA